MKITKELKYATFEYDEEEKDFVIKEEDGNKVILNKVYAFAFMRFVVRMAQRNWLRTKPPKKAPESSYTGLTPQEIGPDWREAQLTRQAEKDLEYAMEDQELPLNHPDQTEFSY